MDLSNSLAKLTNFLLRFDTQFCAVNVHEFESYFITVINADNYQGGGSSKGQIESYLKALGELGESVIAKRLSLPCRSGLAGGLFFHTALARAKEELLERDAFFYHYRTQHPFLSVEQIKELFIVRLHSAIEKVKITLVFNKSYFSGDYFKFGMGSSTDFNESLKKAVDEYYVLELNHQKFTNWFKNSESIVDKHHEESKDRRNVDRIKKLMHPNLSNQVRSIDPSKWKIKKISTPISFFNYVLVSHPELIPIEFGKREENGVLHPFW